MLKLVNGDLLRMAEEGKFQIIVHGCNCQNVMGAGIAAQIKKEYPLAFEADVKATNMWQRPIAKLGNFSFAFVASNKDPNTEFVIFNAYTQLHFEPRGIDHFEYESFSLILRKIYDIAEPGFAIGFPYIGMGLAGGDKARIMEMLQNFALRCINKNISVTLVQYEP